MREEENLMEFVTGSLLRDTPVTVSHDTPLFEDRLLNSMNILDLLGYVEHKLGRRLRDEEIVMANFRSVRAISEKFFSDPA